MDESLSGWYGHVERMADDRVVMRICSRTVKGTQGREADRVREGHVL